MACREPYPGYGTEYLTADFSVTCSTSEASLVSASGAPGSSEWAPDYLLFRIVAIALMVVYVFALPLYILAGMCECYARSVCWRGSQKKGKKGGGGESQTAFSSEPLQTTSHS